jgi:hypothetical protein
VDLGLLAGQRVPFFVLGFFSVSIGMARRWLYPDGRIRSFLPYRRSGGAPSTGGGRVEFCFWWISWDPIRRHIR